MCDECEARFDKRGDYAFNLFAETKPNVIAYDGSDPTASFFENTDSAKLRLFFISLPWRLNGTNRSALASVDPQPHTATAREAVPDGDGSLLPELDIVVTRFKWERSPAG